MEFGRKEFINLLVISGLTGFIPRSWSFRETGRELVKPARLQRGDTVGLLSPAGILPDPKEYDEIAERIAALGFKVKVGRHSRNRYGYLAGTDLERAADLHAMFADPGIKAVIPFRGGWGSARLLELLDFELIGNNPKILLGFSDITALLLAIYAKTRLVTFHGPVGRTRWTDFTTRYFENVLMGSGRELRQSGEELSDPTAIRTITSGTARGRLLGGNLSVLASIMGSEYLPEWEGSLLFLEDIGEDYYRIDRMLTQLKLNGVLNAINGFIFGKCTDCKPSDKRHSLSLEQILDDHIRPLNIPAYSGAMIGHIDNMFTLPIGIEAEMNADTGTIRLLDVPVR